MNLNEIKVECVISFSDALFAFSITLMALSIQIPNLPSNIAESELTKRLGQLIIPNIIHYIISFLVVGMYWIAYHRTFEHIRLANITLIWLNLLFLLSISLVAYFTGLLSTYDTHRIVVIAFSCILATAGFILCIIWWYATHNRKLVDKNMHPHLVRYFLIRGFVSPIIFLTSIGISFIDVQGAHYFWIVIIPTYIIINKIHLPYLSKL
jgi:uncharacterized membrane protein